MRCSGGCLGLALWLVVGTSSCSEERDAGLSAEERPFEPSGDAPVPRARARLGSRNNFVGVFEPATATWQLRLQRPGWNEPASERTFTFGAPGDTPVVGDWDGDGQQTPGVFRTGLWWLSDALDAGVATQTFSFGSQDELPIVGDWDGDGTATVGVFKDGTFRLRNHNSAGEPERVIALGSPGDVPVAGDWDGDGTDTVGVYTPSSGQFVLLDNEGKTTTVALGVPGAQPVVGDWDDDRRDTVGVRLGAAWTLLNDHRVWQGRAGMPVDYGLGAEQYGLGEIALVFGDVGALPVVGNWLPLANRGFPALGPELRELFPLAADYQTPARFESWRALGVNTVIRVRSRADPEPASDAEVDAWTQRANELGLKMIRHPRRDPHADASEPNLLAFLLQDEPDIQELDPFDRIAGTAARLRELELPPRPLFVNFAGWSILRQSEPGSYRYGPGDRAASDFYTRYLALTDWASQDIYAISQMYEQQQMPLGDALATLSLTFDKLRRWAPTQPQFAYIETAQHNGDSLELSAELFRSQLWLAIVNGVRGVFLFSADDCVPGMPCRSEDGTRPDVRRELSVQSARIRELTHVLQGEVDPPSFSVSAAAPLAVGWRESDDLRYLFAVNATERPLERWIRIEGRPIEGAVEVLYEERKVDTVGGYTFRDRFEPYGVRAYRFR